MTEEGQRSSAAEIPVTSNGDLDQSPEAVFQRDSYPGGPGAPNLSESRVTSGNLASTTEGIIESGPYRGNASLLSRTSDDLIFSVLCLQTVVLSAYSPGSDFCFGFNLSEI